MARHRILVVDDESGVRFGVRDFLESHGYDVAEADSGRAAEAAFRESLPDAAIVDYRLPDGDSLELLPRLRAIDRSVPVVILTAHGSIDLAVRAIKEGAEHFLTKPVELPSLLIVLQRLLEAQRVRRRQLAGTSRAARDEINPFAGASPVIRRLAEDAKRVARAESPVLIRGETGIEKGVLARWLHTHSPRAEESFVDINCAGLSRDLLESELFGHEKGAFTGAVAGKVGLLEVAHRGTVFLDEIGDVDPQIQPKLLKVLEEKRFRRVGDPGDRQVDIRLIAATHQDLSRLVREKRFREDLFYRISTIPLVVPPLRERVEDISILARYVLDRVSAELGRAGVSLAPAAEKALEDYRWPGNIRELRNDGETPARSRPMISGLMTRALRIFFPLVLVSVRSRSPTITARAPRTVPSWGGHCNASAASGRGTRSREIEEMARRPRRGAVQRLDSHPDPGRACVGGAPGDRHPDGIVRTATDLAASSGSWHSCCCLDRHYR
jgi:DNA-binding NtrC family response regulator